MKSTDQAVYTRGSIRGTMFRTAISMLPGTLAMSGYNFADTCFVGQLGSEPLAAMGFTMPVVFFMSCIFRGFGSGIMTPAAQMLGSGKRATAAKFVSSGLCLVLIASVLLAVFGVCAGNVLVELLGSTGNTLKYSKSYMDIWYFGCATASLSVAGNDMLIASGSSKTASSMMILGMAVNVALDPLFIFGWWGFPEMGIAGAALATVLSQLLATAVVLYVLYARHRLIVFERIPWRRMRAAWRKIIGYAVPSILGMIAIPVGFSITTRITASFGVDAVAGSTAASRMDIVAFMFPMALGISLMPMVAQNYGARFYGRIRDCYRFANDFAFFYLLGMAVLYFIFAWRIAPLFSPDREVQRIMVMSMRIIPWGFGMLEIHRYCGFFYTGCARPSVAAYFNLMRIFVFLVPYSLLAAYLGSLPGLFLAKMLADVSAALAALCFTARLIRSLPQDGEVPPPPDTKWWRKKFIAQWLPPR